MGWGGQRRGERERMATPARKPHTSTADLLTWSETPPPSSPAVPASRSRSLKPAGGITPVMFGGQLTEEEVESLSKRKICSGPKLREITGSGIFASDNENGASESGGAFATPNKTGLRVYQQTVAAMSQISFSTDESVTPKKPTSVAEVAKQRELTGTLETDPDSKTNKLISDAKCKELSGHDIFAPPPEITPRPLIARNPQLKGNFDFGEPTRNMHTSVKVSNPSGGHSNILFGEEPVMKTSKKIHNQKFQELTGNGIFKGDVPPGSAEKSLSNAKLREMSGSDIFADGKAVPRDFLGGVRKPPGGESSIALV